MARDDSDQTVYFFYTELCWACRFTIEGMETPGELPYKRDGDTSQKTKIKPPKGDQLWCGWSLNWPLKGTILKQTSK